MLHAVLPGLADFPGKTRRPSSTEAFHRRPIGVLVNAGKKSGWHGTLTLPLDRGDDKERQTNRIQAQCARTALQSDFAAFGL